MKRIMLIYFSAILFSSCSKKEALNTDPGISTTPPTTPPIVPCNNRPVINATLVPIGFLSEARIGLASGAAGSKIFFAGGIKAGAYSSRVDIYDTITRTWSTAELSIPERQGVAVATVGTKIFFAGGGNNDEGLTTTRVDIYDAATNVWTTAELSKSREFLTATTLGNKIYFAGGGAWDPHLKGSTVIDIYDNSTNTWTTGSLPQGRMDHSATVAGNKIYFAGGTAGYWTSLNILNSIDIYDAGTNTWTTSYLQEPRMQLASIATGNKIYWASGVNSTTFSCSNTVETRDIVTGASSSTCMIPRSMFNAVTKGDNIIFFTGNQGNDGFSGTRFEIYNTTTDQWSTGVLSKRLNDATIISVNNTVYIAGGRDQPWGPYFNQVWKLEF